MPGTSSKLLISSYVLDVIVIIVFGLISYGISNATPNFHPFSLLDLTISYPFKPDLVTATDAGLAAVLAPAMIIVLVCLLCVPAPVNARSVPRGVLWRAKIWECFVGCMGLALSIVTQLLLVQGMKNIVGKPRPDMLGRCDPDLSNVAAYAVGGYGQGISERWVLVNQTICRQTDQNILNDGFRSFPSGHSGTSFAGLLYLTLYLCTKFAVTFPTLPTSVDRLSKAKDNDYAYLIQYRDGAAAAPTWLLFLIYLPIGAAIYISGSRYFDYRHHGFDILSGALIGIISAWFAYRWYHVPIGRSAGWSWGARSPDRAFGVGIGSYGYADDVFLYQTPAALDLEAGPNPRHTHGLHQSVFSSAEDPEARRSTGAAGR